jgi:hypothetical protein
MRLVVGLCYDNKTKFFHIFEFTDLEKFALAYRRTFAAHEKDIGHNMASQAIEGLMSKKGFAPTSIGSDP